MAVDDAYTVALLHMDGADASTTFTDESGKTWTAAGNAQIDTAQNKFGGASGLFDGTGDYLTGTDSADFDFSGDFTIDFWVRFNDVTNTQYLYDGRPAGTNGDYPALYAFPTGGFHLEYYVSSGVRITGATIISINTWYHVALARSGTSTKLFLGGNQQGSTWTDSTSYINGTSRPMIGDFGVSNGVPLNGWIDELRISKGIARWTANFTPPTVAYGATATGNFFAFF